MQIAYFAGGCFWCVEAIFQRIEGVIKLTSGYCNGNTIDPTYQDICLGATEHAEVVKIEFDESKISFEVLLEVFLKLMTQPHQTNKATIMARNIVLPFFMPIMSSNLKQLT